MLPTPPSVAVAAAAADPRSHPGFTVLSSRSGILSSRRSELPEEVDPVDRRSRRIVGGALALAVIVGGAGVAIAADAGGDDQPLTGSTLDRARAAALAFTGGGTVIESEAGDDGAAYGVEVRLDDGRVVEVSLDSSFRVLGDEADDDGSTEQDGPDDD